MATTSNPLAQYFRQPAIYINLPSGGNYYPPGTLELPENRQVPVYPMTAIDEITYRTPDALISGQAVVNVIQSCIPAIKNAWAIPAVDVDTILVSIRIASYGHDMEFSTACPKCASEADLGLDLRSVLERMVSPDYSHPIKQGDIEIYFKPMSYKNLSDNNKIQFDEQRLLQSIQGNETPDVAQLKVLSQALQKMTEVTVTALAQSILTIKTPQAMVSEPEYIAEFMKNCDRTLFSKIQDYVIEHKNKAEMQPLQIKCSECGHEYAQGITLDMSNFFGRAS